MREGLKTGETFRIAFEPEELDVIRLVLGQVDRPRLSEVLRQEALEIKRMLAGLEEQASRAGVAFTDPVADAGPLESFEAKLGPEMELDTDEARVFIAAVQAVMPVLSDADAQAAGAVVTRLMFGMLGVAVVERDI